MIDPSEIQFPAKDPSPGQLAERLGRSLPRADRAAAEASLAQTLATTAIVLAALAAAVGLGLRKRGRNTIAAIARAVDGTRVHAAIELDVP